MDEILADLSIEDTWWLRNFEKLEERIQVFDFLSKTVVPVNLCKVPWPVVWALARYNRKHIWATRKLPPTEWMCSALQEFCQRMRWKWHFRDKKSAKPSIWFRSNTHCGEIIDPGLQFWLDRFYQLMAGETVKVQKRAKRKKEAVSNMSSLVRWGIRLLKDSKWKACWTDKTSSYALVEKRQISTIHDDILDKQTYIPTVYDIYMVDSHVKRYFQVAHNIQILENSPELGAQLRKSTKLTGACLISRLNFTVKSHKPQGQVSVRNLHCSGKYSFKGVGLWLQKRLASKLDNIPYLIKNPIQVGLLLRDISLSSGVSVYKFDIKEFFISGPLGELQHDAMAIFEHDNNATKRTIAEAMSVLLSSQFVRSDITGRCVQVCEGSGMGLPQSGGIADAAFHTKAEQVLLDPVSREQAGILAYLRFKDDGLIFSNNRVGIQQWFQRFRDSADYYKVICEQVVDFNSKESQELQFLQFRIVLCAKTCRVRVMPHSKSVAVPLSQFSAHAPSTKNWLVAHLKSMCQLASDRLAAEETKRHIIKRFLTQGSPPGILEQMLAV